MIETLAVALLALAAVALVAWPLVHAPAANDAIVAADPRDLDLIRWREQRDEAVAAIAELDLDLRTGKLDGADHAELVARERQRAGEAIAALERLEVPREPAPGT